MLPVMLSSHARRRGAALGLITAAALLIAGCASSTAGHGTPGGPGGSSGSSAAAGGHPSSSAPSTRPVATGKPVHASLLQADGGIYGIGEPIVARFTASPTDSTQFTKAVKITVNGAPATGAWYWEKVFADKPIEAHYRLPSYWPANSKIHVDMPLTGLSAGRGLVFADSLTLDASIGDAHVSTVTSNPLQMTVTDNGKVVKQIPVSLGAAATPTYSGTKIVMQRGEDVPGTDKPKPDGIVHMVGPGYSEDVKWSVRMTMDGEYIHAAPWNSHIGQVSTSNGCTNLSVTDAQWFYGHSLLGDVVIYQVPNTTMPVWDGLGDWNLSWSQWQGGGELLNH
jgi:lipoprotein-anchoring transpeptidase ErfK/SrfK